MDNKEVEELLKERVEAKITDMHEAIEESLEDIKIVDIDCAHKRLSGISLDCLKRALDECLEGKRDLFK